MEYKYKIGDTFECDGDRVYVTGYNEKMNCYKGTITFENGRSVTSDVILEMYIDNIVERTRKQKELVSLKKTASVKYRIYYYEIDELTGEILRGQSANNKVVKLSGIKALARLLNNMRKNNPNRRITLVSVVDDENKYVTNVKLLHQEIKEQKFLTGTKERLLANAKYERGYELAINF